MKKSEYENHRKKFIEVRDILQAESSQFALVKAYKKPFKWYGEHTAAEAVEILKSECA